VWSIGATSDADSRVKFDTFLRDVIKGKNADYPVPDIFGGKLDVAMPDNGLIYDFYFMVKKI
jgi:hypothetical protein